MATDAKAKRKFIIVSHTHWDRQWHQPFEAFRARLVRMMDSLIDLFERDPEFKHFVMDGQTVPLDDYLEIRPDRRGTIEKLIHDGRLLIGPNYMLPDEFLIGGEAWVRNLQFGIRSARKYGGVMNIGYSPDAFGHIAHLPAILRGFGIDAVLIWRGVGREVGVSEWRVPLGLAGRLRGAGPAFPERLRLHGGSPRRRRGAEGRAGGDASLAGAAGDDEPRARSQRHRPPARARRPLAGDQAGQQDHARRRGRARHLPRFRGGESAKSLAPRATSGCRC
ncbi:MAG: hypothetical protein M3O21_01965 [Chloroflexota bacterium]|nr:hypothetical protein [Chloroflexota bacterium]